MSWITQDLKDYSRILLGTATLLLFVSMLTRSQSLDRAAAGSNSCSALFRRMIPFYSHDCGAETEASLPDASDKLEGDAVYSTLLSTSPVCAGMVQDKDVQLDLGRLQSIPEKMTASDETSEMKGPNDLKDSEARLLKQLVGTWVLWDCQTIVLVMGHIYSTFRETVCDCVSMTRAVAHIICWQHI